MAETPLDYNTDCQKDNWDTRKIGSKVTRHKSKRQKERQILKPKPTDSKKTIKLW